MKIDVEKLKTPETDEDVKRGSRTFGILLACLIIVVCVGSIALDTIHTKNTINRQLDVIENKLMAVDQKLDEIVFFLQNASIKPLSAPVDYSEVTAATIDSLADEVHDVQVELNTLKGIKTEGEKELSSREGTDSVKSVE